MIPWGLILRLLAGAVVAGCIAWIILVLKSWHDDSAALPGVRQELSQSIQRNEQLRKDNAAEVNRAWTIADKYRVELAELKRVRAALPARVVRLCIESAAGVPAGSGGAAAPGGDDGSTAGAGLLPQTPRAGPDIGPDLYALIDQADEFVPAFRALQDYVRTLPKACRSPL